MRFTRKNAEQLAELMLKDPNVEYRLMSNAVLYKEDIDSYNRGRDLFVGIKMLGRIPEWADSEDDARVMWNCVLATLLENPVYSKLKYKTHLRDYLYKDVNRALKLLRGRIVKPSGHEEIDSIIRGTDHWEYRTRKPIGLTTVIFRNNQIKVSSEHTVYVAAKLDKKIEKDELLKLHEQVRELAVNNPKVKIRGKGYKNKEYIENEYYRYEEAYRRHVELFNILRELWEWKVKEDGIYEGTADDKVRDVLHKYNHEFTSLRNRNQPLGKMTDIKYSLVRDLKKIRSMDDNTIEVSVYL